MIAYVLVKHCKLCIKEFIVDFKFRNAKYCSQQCYQKNKKGPNHPCWAGGLIYLKCKYCGIDFQIKKSRKKTSKYCSGSCRSKGMSRKFGPEHHSWKGGCNCCIDCGVELQTWNKNAKRCCNCYHIHQSGENSRFWRGGISYTDNKIVSDRKYKKWRMCVLIRDDYICQICGQRGGKLEVHHIKRRKDSPEKTLDETNGITLCQDCHRYKVNYHEKDYEEQFTKVIEKKYNVGYV